MRTAQARAQHVAQLGRVAFLSRDSRSAARIVARSFISWYSTFEPCPPDQALAATSHPSSGNLTSAMGAIPAGRGRAARRGNQSHPRGIHCTYLET
jgi:hypothetical protein